MGDDTPKGRLIQFLKTHPPPPLPPPRYEGYVCFCYEGFAVCSAPLFNVVLLSLATHDPDLYRTVAGMLGVDYLDE